ncbi:NAD(P)-binding protein [Polyplosphaeria fusca]|uniref:NAD(P)-binding protein n=1 Tax=Polyplosphaeria fusca TaxID=682080 RepID=A0A9P4QMN7_9PLEO|nr:NAD(P)-binding protein [Polyplosphaeria fusca]
MASIDPNAFTLPFQLTKSMHRDVYEAIDPKNPGLRASDKVVVVTGAGGGIGYAVAKAWSTAGARGIVLAGRSAKKLEAVAADLSISYLTVEVDLANEKDIESLFAKTVDKFGTVDVVVNAAGGGTTIGVVPGQTEPSQWWLEYEISVKGYYNLAHHFIKATGGKGTLINMTTVGVSLSAPGMSSYGPAKLAALKIAELLDLEFPNLRVFSIHPGIVEAENGRGIIIDHFTPFAKDKAALTGSLTLYLQKPESDYLRGGFVSANWDVEEMERHKDEIVEGKLLRLQFLAAKLGAEGHPWEHRALSLLLPPSLSTTQPKVYPFLSSIVAVKCALETLKKVIARGDLSPNHLAGAALGFEEKSDTLTVIEDTVQRKEPVTIVPRNDREAKDLELGKMPWYDQFSCGAPDYHKLDVTLYVRDFGPEEVGQLELEKYFKQFGAEAVRKRRMGLERPSLQLLQARPSPHKALQESSNAQEIIKQVEFYFSDANIYTDKFKRCASYSHDDDRRRQSSISQLIAMTTVEAVHAQTTGAISEAKVHLPKETMSSQQLARRATTRPTTEPRQGGAGGGESGGQCFNCMVTARESVPTSASVTSAAEVGFPINLSRLEMRHTRFSSYEPALFPGIVYKMLHTSVPSRLTGARHSAAIARTTATLSNADAVPPPTSHRNEPLSPIDERKISHGSQRR